MKNLIEITKCENTILADEIIDALEDEGIATMTHDENNDTAYGAYGGSTGISIKVYEEDAEMAREIVAEIMEERGEMKPWCPKCGSDDVSPIAERRVRLRYDRTTVIMAVLLIGFCAFVGIYFKQWIMFVTIVFFLIADQLLGAKVDHHCNQCGHDFKHKK